MATLAAIRRHPVKGFGEEAVESARLTEGLALPFDRRWAIAMGDAGPAAASGWRDPGALLRVSLYPELALAKTSFDEGANLLTLFHPDLGEVAADPDAEPDAFAAWVAPLADKRAEGPYRLIASPPTAFTDFEHPHLSIGSLSSLRALSEMAGTTLDPRRFRMNLWVEGWAPWEEFDLVGQTLRIGDASIHVIEPDPRCAATHANPETGARDVDVTRTLYNRFRHKDFGLYCTVAKGGDVAVGDEVSL